MSRLREVAGLGHDVVANAGQRGDRRLDRAEAATELTDQDIIWWRVLRVVFEPCALEVLHEVLVAVFQTLPALAGQRVAMPGHAAIIAPVGQEATGNTLAGLGEALRLARR